MIEVRSDYWDLIQQDKQIVFVHTPFCATCQLAERMLTIMEESYREQNYYRLNASFFPVFMEKNKITSVPALLLVKNGVVEDKLYAFESVVKLHEVLNNWK
ncbi:thioredoxin [Gracilibacillus boraciitolerans JCM 21714]|uniref:Thioredoxin n=1 Tax=Gracilibacillus boraciitolerans JCM 21714 TaxID=1298598 RepID=W4VI62_9BACI|nr:thioredoxin family protein [Gracilibacillus boraciitolerans]GAE92856.1 thioredoxin [Gracilibacillus boraciitolerans JCM 21714]